MNKTTALVLLAVLPLCAAAQDFPKMRAGLWQTTSTTRSAGSSAKPSSHVSTICLDESVRKLMVQLAQGTMRGMCSKHDMKVSGSTVTADARCELLGSRISTRSVMKFSGDTSYRAQAHSVYSPPVAGRAEADTTVDGKYTGPCPADMKPGDLRLPGGKTINIKALSLGG